MSNLFGAMRTSLDAMAAVQKAMTVSQNNVANASVPGYVRQQVAFISREFNPETGLAGGVTTSGLISARDEYLETTVRTHVSLLSDVQETWTNLTSVESALDLNDNSGVPANLDRLFTAFSAWSVAPADQGAKENVVAAAEEVAASFNRTAETIAETGRNASAKIDSSVDELNALAEQVRKFNQSVRTGDRGDAGIDGIVHEALERMSELVDIRTVWQQDGSVTVLAGGEAPLVVGDKAYQLRVSGNQPVAITSEAGDITDKITGGQLAGLIRFKNETVPEIIGSPGVLGTLDQLAKAVADRVNTILSNGFPPLDPPLQLFTYGISEERIAQTLKANPMIAQQLLDATSANKTALDLASLATKTDTTTGLTLVGEFGRISRDIGRKVASAKQETESRQGLTAQARNMRAEASGVSFNEEAVNLVELQRAYQATARMISTINEMLDVVIAIGRA